MITQSNSPKTAFLRAYGLLRLVYGCALLVGLSGGYFLLEWVFSYPDSAAIQILDKDILALLTLAVVLRGIFHACAGAGIALGRDGARYILYFGWPVMLLLSTGLGFSLQDEFPVRLSLMKALLYVIVPVFDIFLISPILHESGAEPKQRLSGQWNGRIVVLTAAGSVLVFSLILFLGKPIKQGFHAGFYKSSGKIETAAVTHPASAARKQDPRDSLPETGAAVLKGTTPESSTRIYAVSLRKAATDIGTGAADGAPTETQVKAEASETAKGPGMPYRALMGYLGSLFIIAALGMSALIGGSKDAAVPLSFWVLLSGGFFLWIFYGIGFRLFPVTLTALAGTGLSLYHLVIRLKI